MKQYISEKIDRLFHDRFLWSMIDYYDLSDSFAEKLKLLQREIYGLDLLLESVWNIPEQSLEKRRLGIFRRLEEFGIDLAAAKEYCREIQFYEDQEMLLRKNIYPQADKIEVFYYFKACDIRLMRRLIMEEYSNERAIELPEYWSFLDIITEILDDLDDVIEDANTYSLNFLLLYFWLHGREKTKSLFYKFLRSLEDRFDQDAMYMMEGFAIKIHRAADHKLVEAFSKLDLALEQIDQILKNGNIALSRRLSSGNAGWEVSITG